MKKLALLALALSLAAPAAMAERYEIDPNHTDVIASWNHFGFSNPSLHVGQAKGVIVYDKAKPGASSVQVEMPLSSIDTHVPKLDEHLAGSDFFDVAHNPNASFKSTAVHPMGEGQLHVEGILTLHGVSKPVALMVKLNQEGVHPMSKRQSIGFDATATIKRSDFGLDKYAPAVSDEVQLRITTEASVADTKAPTAKN